MRTAEEMYNYCLENGFGSGMNRKWGLKHFAIIEKNLSSDEEPQMCFIGLHNYISISKHDQNFAYCITDRRIMMAQQKLIGEVFQNVSFDRVNDVTMQTGMLMGTLTIDTMNEKFNVGVNKVTIDNINTRIHDVLERVRNQGDRKESADVAIGLSAADEIMKFKKLLDAGVITQEEFDKKKAQLLKL